MHSPLRISKTSIWALSALLVAWGLGVCGFARFLVASMAEKGIAQAQVEHMAFLTLPLCSGAVILATFAWVSRGDLQAQKLLRLPLIAAFLMAITLIVGLRAPFYEFRDLQTAQATQERIAH
jgi:hypothetical protein